LRRMLFFGSRGREGHFRQRARKHQCRDTDAQKQPLWGGEVHFWEPGSRLGTALPWTADSNCTRPSFKLARMPLPWISWPDHVQVTGSAVLAILLFVSNFKRSVAISTGCNVPWGVPLTWTSPANSTSRVSWPTAPWSPRAVQRLPLVSKKPRVAFS